MVEKGQESNRKVNYIVENELEVKKERAKN
jgi:hypothetical protein